MEINRSTCSADTGGEKEIDVLSVDFLAPIQDIRSVQQLRLRWLRSLWGLPPKLESSDSLVVSTWAFLVGCQLENNDPVVRLLTWQSSCWLFAFASSTELQKMLLARETLESSVAPRIVRWMIQTALLDADEVVREFASREINKLFAAAVGIGAFGAFVDSSYQCSSICPRSMMQLASFESSPGSHDAVDSVVSRLFGVMDDFLGQVPIESPTKEDVSVHVDNSIHTSRTLLGLNQSVNKSLFVKAVSGSAMSRMFKMIARSEALSNLQTVSTFFLELCVFCRTGEDGWKASKVSEEVSQDMLMCVIREVLAPGRHFTRKPFHDERP